MTALAALKIFQQTMPSLASPDESSTDLPIPTDNELQSLADGLVGRLRLFSRESSPVPVTAGASTPEETMKKLALDIDRDISSLLTITSTRSPVGKQLSETIKKGIEAAKEHIKSIETLRNETPEIHFSDSDKLEGCERLITIVEANLSVIDRNIERFIHSGKSPFMPFPPNFARIAELRAFKPIDTSTYVNKGHFGTVSIITHKADVGLNSYAIKFPPTAQALRNDLLNPNSRDSNASVDSFDIRDQVRYLQYHNALLLAQETDTLFSLPSHPNIMECYGVTQKSEPIMEPISNGDLYTAITLGALNGMQMEIIAKETADAVACLHENGIIHCDIKPDNIGLTVSGHPKLLDFGLARSHFTEEDRYKRAGTVDYMSSEMIYTGETKDEKTDIFSYGATLYTMLTQRFFYNDLYLKCDNLPKQYLQKVWKADKLMNFLFKKQETIDIDQAISDTIEDSIEENKSLSPEQKIKFKSILKSCMKYEPDHRPSMKDVLQMFEV